MYLDSLLLSKNSYVDGVSGCDSFAFENKRIAFFYGKEDIVQITKKTFFEKEKYALNLTRRFSLGCNQLLIFTKEEARQVGYDAVIIHRNRRLVSKKEVVKKIKEEMRFAISFAKNRKDISYFILSTDDRGMGCR